MTAPRTFNELQEAGRKLLRESVTQAPGLGVLVLTYNRGDPASPFAFVGAVDSAAEAIRVLREAAAKIERDQATTIPC